MEYILDVLETTLWHSLTKNTKLSTSWNRVCYIVQINAFLLITTSFCTKCSEYSEAIFYNCLWELNEVPDTKDWP